MNKPQEFIINPDEKHYQKYETHLHYDYQSNSVHFYSNIPKPSTPLTPHPNFNLNASNLPVVHPIPKR